ncbi:hypothetical protein HID58_066617 [Brassica napus]|uniref:Amidohydrolase-related domain-containing protein n=1 Tax=Brassica napus TaxID=3708 RepID=A0ABQ7ZGF6_BRANA|nr:hypothetical protein HID58_066617 [Brassica napus]
MNFQKISLYASRVSKQEIETSQASIGMTCGTLHYDKWSPFGSLATYPNISASRLYILLNTDNQLQLPTYLPTINLTQNHNFFEWEVGVKISSTFNTMQEDMASLLSVTGAERLLTTTDLPHNLPSLTNNFILDLERAECLALLKHLPMVDTIFSIIDQQLFFFF